MPARYFGLLLKVECRIRGKMSDIPNFQYLKLLLENVHSRCAAVRRQEVEGRAANEAIQILALSHRKVLRERKSKISLSAFG